MPIGYHLCQNNDNAVLDVICAYSSFCKCFHLFLLKLFVFFVICIYIYILYNISYLGYGDLSTHSIAIPRGAKAKCGIAMLSVDTFPIRWNKQEVTNLSPCLKNVCHILKRFDSFEIQAIVMLFICLNNCINIMLSGCIAAARKMDSGRDRHCDIINDVPFSFYLTLIASNVR